MLNALWRAFIDGLIYIDNDEKVASLENTPSWRLERKNRALFENKNGQNRYPIYDQNDNKTITRLGPQIAHIRK